MFNFAANTLTVSPSIAENPSVTSASVSQALIVPAGIDRIELLATSERPVVIFDPVALSAGSQTGVLIRLDDEDAGLDVISFPGQAVTGNDGTARVRLILVSDPGTTDGTGQTTLVPAGDNPAVAEAMLPIASIEFPVGDYVTAAPGDYALTSSFLEGLAVTLEPDTSYSLVLDPNDSENVLRLIDESDLD